MGKKLAIKGHPTRGKEVIELLEMLGGINGEGYFGTNTWKDEYYFLDNDGYIHAYDWCDGIKFTLEEFLEKYPFKVGDKVVYTKFGDNCDDFPVIIESMKWTGTTIEYTFDDCVTCLAKDLKMWNSNDNYTKPSKIKNVLAELLEHIKTTPKEDLEREFNELEEWSNVGPTVEEFMAFCESVNKKPVYPKTIKECIKCINAEFKLDSNCYEAKLFANFYRLIICRDAYWKIAGEEMGLGKPWKHDYLKDANTIRYTIYNTGDEIVKLDGKLYRNYTLCFPTAEMRDAFAENFKDLIEQCKELL